MVGNANVSFYRLGDRVLSLVQDSKSKTSFYYHLPIVRNVSRDVVQKRVISGGNHYYGRSEDLIIYHRNESNTYQSYLFFDRTPSQ